MSNKVLSLGGWCNHLEQIGAPYSGFLDFTPQQRKEYTEDLHHIVQHIADEIGKVKLLVDRLIEQHKPADKFALYIDHPVLLESIKSDDLILELGHIAGYFRRTPGFKDRVHEEDSTLALLASEMAIVRISVRHWKALLSDPFVCEAEGVREIMDALTELPS